VGVRECIKGRMACVMCLCFEMRTRSLLYFTVMSVSVFFSRVDLIL
jgi:hypothetical protein